MFDILEKIWVLIKKEKKKHDRYSEWMKESMLIFWRRNSLNVEKKTKKTGNYFRYFSIWLSNLYMTNDWLSIKKKISNLYEREKKILVSITGLPPWNSADPVFYWIVINKQ